MGLRHWLRSILSDEDGPGSLAESPRRFERVLAAEVDGYEGPRAEAVSLGPDLYVALSNLMEDGRIHDEARGLVCRAIAYFIMPFDVLPEELYGAEGYLDDVYFCLWTLDRLSGELPGHILEDAWEGEGLLLDVVEELLPAARDALETSDREKILRYVGLSGELGEGDEA